ncbi:DNA-directed RNA polymerase subunit alpha [bacterium]|nr:DNA-directed RNA polymerase subunit alpha [bacterium]
MEKFLKPTFSKQIYNDDTNPNKAVFSLKKLEKGFAQTLGNSLRRVLLSSIPSVAPFAIEIKNILFEFSPIENVEEDVVELILNLKKIVFSVDENIIKPDEILELTLSANEGEVFASQISSPAGVEIVNKDLVIAHSYKPRALEFKLYLSYSKGYKTFEENRETIRNDIGEKPGIIPIDSIFSPIKNVSFKINEVNPGEEKTYEELLLSIETKGSITPDKAIAYASKILIEYLNAFSDMVVINMDEIFIEEEEPVEEENESNLEVLIEELNLSVRSENSLKKEGIKSLNDLIDRPISSLKNINNLGEKSIQEIINLVKDMGLSFKSE